MAKVLKFENEEKKNSFLFPLIEIIDQSSYSILWIDLVLLFGLQSRERGEAREREPKIWLWSFWSVTFLAFVVKK